MTGRAAGRSRRADRARNRPGKFRGRAPAPGPHRAPRRADRGRRRREPRHRSHGRRRAPRRQLGHAARQRDPPAIEQCDPVAHALHLIEMMRGQQNRGAVGLERRGSCREILASNADPGSRSARRGWRCSARFISTSASPRRWRMPRENVADPVPPTSGNPTRVSASANRSSISRRDNPASRAGIGEVVAGRQPVVEADRSGR